MAKLGFFKGDSSRIDLQTTPFNEGSFYLTSDDGTLYLDYVNSNTGEQIRLPVNAKEEEVSNIVEKYFLIVETVKQGADYLLDGITFDEIYEKFNTTNVNMVCHVDGTDYIPLLSVTTSSIIFSGIYNATSVSLVFNSNGVGTLTSTYLSKSSDLNRYYTKTETDKQIADLVNSAPETLDTLGELATAFQENKEVVDTLNSAITNKADTSIVPTNLVNGSAIGSLRGINTIAESDSYIMGVNAFAIGNGTKASGKNSFASGQDVEATGSYAHAEGYGTFATAAAAHAEGYDTHATARYAHAEGASTTASGNNSHAEGNSTTSSGHYSHAEGNFTTAAGGYSHAEGNYAQTGENGTYAHAEGSYTKAMATGAHAEGNYCEANGVFSHTEGNRTLANSMYQHVRGKYNIPDNDNVYSTIIGNGDADTNRKNIYTLDWNGNAWFAGDIYIGSDSGANKDDGSMKVATENFVSSEIAELLDSMAWGKF